MLLKQMKLFFSIIFMVASIPVGAQANTSWDFVYGDDPLNGNNVSAYMDIKVDPLGGTFLIGYFFGSYEGLSSGSNYGLFVQHRSENGTVDWTRQYGSFPSNQTPGKWFGATVDGLGNLFINQFDTSYNQLQAGSEVIYGGTWHSVSRTGVVSTEATSSRCTQGVGAPEGGVVRLCDTSALPWSQGKPTTQAIEKADTSFNTIWQSDATTFLDGMCLRNEPAEPGTLTAGGCESLVAGANGSVWLIDGLNVNNFSSNQALLPQSLRSAIGMSQWNTTNGSRTNSIKHYGMLPLKAMAVSDRSLWLAVRTLDPSACYLGDLVNCSEEFPNASFNSSNGALRGYFGNKFNLFPRFGRNTLHPEAYRYLFDNGITTRNLEDGGFRSSEWCTTKAFTWGSASWVGAERLQFTGSESSDCPAGSHWSTFITNDGRRLALVVAKQLIIWEINEDSNGVPQIGSLISRRIFSSLIQAIDADSLGNIYVVGSTTEVVLIPNEVHDIRAQSSLASTRAFVAKNPTGRFGLTVLPRTPLKFKVTGTNGVPATGVGAVSMNVTVDGPTGEGYITVYPCGTRPEASNLNFVLNQTVPNAVIAPVSSDGEICFYTYAETHLLADINGYFPSGQGFVPVTPVRVADTRAASGQGARTVPKVKIGGETELRFQATGIASVTPSTGVGAVSLNITVTNSITNDFGGYLTVYPCGNRPDASSLNFRTGQTVPNSVIAPVSSSGEVCIYGYGTADVIVDINGYFPAGQGFVAVTPARVADTRAASVQGLRTVNKTRIGGDTELRVKVTDLAGVTPASGVGAVSMNVTATNTTTDNFGGYLTVYPCGNRPEASNVNYVSGQTVPNAVITPVSASGEICIWARGNTDVIVDVNGYFPTGQGFVPLTPIRAFDTR